MQLLCTVSHVNGKRYKKGNYYNFDKNPFPGRFIEAVEEEIQPSQALSEMQELILTNVERMLILSNRKKANTPEDLSGMTFNTLKKLATEKKLNTEGIHTQEEMLLLIKG